MVVNPTILPLFSVCFPSAICQMTPTGVPHQLFNSFCYYIPLSYTYRGVELLLERV